MISSISLPAGFEPVSCSELASFTYGPFRFRTNEVFRVTDNIALAPMPSGARTPMVAIRLSSGRVEWVSLNRLVRGLVPAGEPLPFRDAQEAFESLRKQPLKCTGFEQRQMRRFDGDHRPTDEFDTVLVPLFQLL